MDQSKAIYKAKAKEFDEILEKMTRLRIEHLKANEPIR